MPNFHPTIDIDMVIEALGAFVQLFMQGGVVTRAQVNRVPFPEVPNAVLTELLTVDIDLPYGTYELASSSLSTIHGPQRIDIQIDVYGALAGEIITAIKTAFRSEWAASQFPESIKPLYTDDGIQAPLVTGEQQYESRWTLKASLQYNPTMTVPQQFADVSTVTVALTDAVDLPN